MNLPSEQAQEITWPSGREFWRGRVVRGSVILLLGTGFVAATNLLYNIFLARRLGAAGFGHASALYTFLMLMAAITLSFQIVTSKFIARNSETQVQAQLYATLLRRSWQVGLGVAVLIAAGSGYLQSYLNLPAQHDLLLLAIATGIYIPLGVRRGRLQGCYAFSGLALNVVVEVVVKFGAALLFLHLGMGVTGVMIAILLSIAAAYLVSPPGAEFRVSPGKIKIAPLGEGIQAVSYFVGQVILSNLDILLVKHFFPASEAGIYAAVALVGRVVFMVSWSVVSSMFPVSASHTDSQQGRSVLYTALFLVGSLTSIFIVMVGAAPEAVWTLLLGRQFLPGTHDSFSALLTEYAGMTGVYSIAVVVMMYEISRRIGTAAWVQLVASGMLAGAICDFHHSLSQVILVQVFVMVGLLLGVTIPLFHEPQKSESALAACEPLRLLHIVPEEKIIAEFLKGEFYHPEYESARRDFTRLVERNDLNNPEENLIRRALLFRRRGRLWRELPPDTEWWEVELTAQDLSRLQSFPRNEWKRFAGGGFRLTEMVERIAPKMAKGQRSRLIEKINGIAADLRESRNVPDAVLLIGVDEYHPLTIIEGNHRMIAALLTMPDSAHRRFRFYCGLSPNMDACCWHKTNLRSVARYGRHTIDYLFRDADFLVETISRAER